MEAYTEKQIQEALNKVETMGHFEMCRLWRFAPIGSAIYFNKSYPVAEAFKKRLFEHFGGFTPGISKTISL